MGDFRHIARLRTPAGKMFPVQEYWCAGAWIADVAQADAIPLDSADEVCDALSRQCGMRVFPTTIEKPVIEPVFRRESLSEIRVDWHARAKNCGVD